MSDPRYTNRGFGLKQVVGGTVVRDYASPLVDRMREEGYRLEASDLTFHLAQEFGFCYGVDRAIEYAYETREKFPGRGLFITGEIIHNPRVNAKLTSMGIRFLDGSDDRATYDALGESDVVLLPAFGVPTGTMERLRGIGCIVVDTTCGSVLNVWKNVERYAKDGFTSLIHGTWHHEETRATSSRAGAYVVVRDMDEAELLARHVEEGGRAEEIRARLSKAFSSGFDPDRDLERIGCANQTTMLAGESLAIAARMRRAFVARHGEAGAVERFRAFDTICSATQERQDALEAMLDRTALDVLVVVGGYNSSNTTHLLEIGLLRHVPTYHVADASSIASATAIRHQPLHAQAQTESRGWLPAGPASIGLTAGASTPNAELERVIRRIAEVRGVALPS
jgi:4-hydroxy-3-methylbut-2-enyl diphosphate reductase